MEKRLLLWYYYMIESGTKESLYSLTLTCDSRATPRSVCQLWAGSQTGRCCGSGRRSAAGGGRSWPASGWRWRTDSSPRTHTAAWTWACPPCRWSAPPPEGSTPGQEPLWRIREENHREADGDETYLERWRSGSVIGKKQKSSGVCQVNEWFLFLQSPPVIQEGYWCFSYADIFPRLASPVTEIISFVELKLNAQSKRVKAFQSEHMSW